MWCKLTFLTLILLLGNYASYYEVQASPKPKSHLTSFLHRVKRQGDSFLHELMYFYTFWTILWNHNFNTWNFYFLIEQNSFFSIYWLTFRKLLQGRKWLPKSGGTSSNTSSNAAPSILPKSGGEIAPPAPSSLTPLFYIYKHLGYFQLVNIL